MTGSNILDYVHVPGVYSSLVGYVIGADRLRQVVETGARHLTAECITLPVDYVHELDQQELIDQFNLAPPTTLATPLPSPISSCSDVTAGKYLTKVSLLYNIT